METAKQVFEKIQGKVIPKIYMQIAALVAMLTISISACLCAHYIYKLPYRMPDSMTVYSNADEELSNIDRTLGRIETEINFLRKGIKY